MNILSIGYLVIFLSLINLIRMTVFLVGSHIYSLKQHLAKKIKRNWFPKISVVVPAHNEEKTISKCLTSITNSNYPKNKLNVIVVNDGSKDNTIKVVRQFVKHNKSVSIKLVSQENHGKASALNNGIKNYAKGELIMCLDADSMIEKNAIRNVTKYFLNKKIAAVASNIKIIESNSLLNLIQRFEYLISYQMKRAQTTYNIEYIIGGIGSTFRRSVLEKVGYYDTNTVTEDIDLTMKILQLGNKDHRVVYASDVISYTESVLDINGLLRQRYRWKWGRCQTFLKNINLFFNPSKKYSKGLTFFYLPYAIFMDAVFLLEPLVNFFILYLVFVYGDLLTIFSAILVINTYIVFNILSEDSLGLEDKMTMIVMAPTMYFYFYVLSFVEYYALIKFLINLKDLRKSIQNENQSWGHVERAGIIALAD